MATMPINYQVAYDQGMGGCNNIIWTIWNQQATASTQTINNIDCWVQWNQGLGTQTGVYYAVAAPHRAPTAEERAVWARQEEEGRLAARKLEQERQEARQRAEELLFLMLSPEQQKQYKEKGYFETEVNDNRYRLYKGRSGNIKKLNKQGREEVSLCVHPVEWTPDEDTLLAQFLALHSDEASLLGTANHTRLI